MALGEALPPHGASSLAVRRSTAMASACARISAASRTPFGAQWWIPA